MEPWSVRVGRDPRGGHAIVFVLEKEGLRRYRGLSGASGPESGVHGAQISQVPALRCPPFPMSPGGCAFSDAFTNFQRDAMSKM